MTTVDMMTGWGIFTDREPHAGLLWWLLIWWQDEGDLLSTDLWIIVVLIHTSFDRFFILILFLFMTDLHDTSLLMSMSITAGHTQWGRMDKWQGMEGRGALITRANVISSYFLLDETRPLRTLSQCLQTLVKILHGRWSKAGPGIPPALCPCPSRTDAMCALYV